MNYLKEVLAFNEWAELHRITATEFRLWHALMHYNNRFAWSEWFSVPLSVLSIATGIEVRSLQRARNRLAQHGRIQFESRSGNQSARYRIHAFLTDNVSNKVSDNVSDTMSCNVSNKVSNSASYNVSTLNKLKETKTKQTPPIPPKGFDRFWDAYPRKTAKAPARKAFDRLKPDGVLLETMLHAIEAHKASEQWTRDGGQFIPHPATWLNQRRWEDELEAPSEAVKVVFD